MRRRGLSPQDAEDLTQNFLLYLIESDFLDRPDPLMGRFRGYLIGGLRHYLSAHFEREQAQKRGGRATFLDWSRVNAEDELRRLGTAPADPSQAYETTWALALLAQALKRLEAEQRAAGKERHFSVLKPFIGAPPGPGEYEGAARKLGASRANVAVWVHRLGHRYGELVKMEVAATLSDPADIEDEMRHLFRALQLSG
jgi:RNA polymerase sigma-70 factor (ECF subfamily)